MPTLDVGDARLDYDVTGDSGPYVVQLHGLTSCRARDAAIGLDLGRALRDHRILRFDARGHGRSSGTLDSDSYSWPRLAADLLALIDDVSPNEPVHGIGTSAARGGPRAATVSEHDAGGAPDGLGDPHREGRRLPGQRRVGRATGH